jgi:ribose/xylose/arabinose/galactoside ABC-type transport system permease subunit
MRSYLEDLFRRQPPVLWLIFGLLLTVAPIRPEIFSALNLGTLILGTSLLLFLALGQGIVLITAGIDLSFPATMSLVSVIGASIIPWFSYFVGREAAVPLAVLMMLGVGMAVGLMQGIAVGVLKMPAFLVSLASLMWIGGIAVWYTASERISIPEGLIDAWYGSLLGLPYPVCTAIVLSLTFHFVLRYTVIGRWLYAIGHSLPTATVSGLPVGWILIFAYICSGFCAALAAVFYTARLHSGSPDLVGNEVLLDCIGAAVIGGTSLSGGRGKVSGILLGAIFMALVGNSLNLLGLRFWHVIIVKGSVILLAATVEALYQNQAEAK